MEEAPEQGSYEIWVNLLGLGVIETVLQIARYFSLKTAAND